MNFPDFNSPDGTRSYTLDSNINVYVTDSEQEAIQSTIDAYNQSHGTSYTYDDFMSDMTNNPIDALVGRGEGQDTTAFTEWSKDVADLSYISDSDVSKSANPSQVTNYQYILDKQQGGPLSNSVTFSWE